MMSTRNRRRRNGEKKSNHAPCCDRIAILDRERVRQLLGVRFEFLDSVDVRLHDLVEAAGETRLTKTVKEVGTLGNNRSYRHGIA